MPVLTIGIVRDCFYLLIFYSEKFSTWVWRLPFAVNVNLNLSCMPDSPYVRTEAVSGKKKLRIQRKPDTCGRGLSVYFDSQEDWSLESLHDAFTSREFFEQPRAQGFPLLRPFHEDEVVFRGEWTVKNRNLSMHYTFLKHIISKGLNYLLLFQQWGTLILRSSWISQQCRHIDRINMERQLGTLSKQCF